MQKKTKEVEKREISALLEGYCPCCFEVSRFTVGQRKGSSVVCSSCGETFYVKDAERIQVSSTAQGNCPHCDLTLKFSDRERAGGTILCPKCNGEFVISDVKNVTLVDDPITNALVATGYLGADGISPGEVFVNQEDESTSTIQRTGAHKTEGENGGSSWIWVLLLIGAIIYGILQLFPSKWTMMMCGSQMTGRLDCQEITYTYDDIYSKEQCLELGARTLKSSNGLYTGFECGNKCKYDGNFWVCDTLVNSKGVDTSSYIK